MKVFACLAGLVLAASHSLASPVIVEELNGVPQGWVKQDRVPASKELHFRIALKQDNQEEFEQHVIDISTPGHKLYGQHMSHEDLKRALKPADEASHAILDWLHQSGISAVENDGEWINFWAKAGEAEQLMDTQFYYYKNEVNGAVSARTLRYSVPEEVESFVHMIQPTTRFGQIKPQRSHIFDIGPPVVLSKVKALAKGSSNPSAIDADACNQMITPNCLRQLYRIGDYEAKGKHGRLGINGFLNQYAKYDDLEQFLKTYAPDQDPKVNNFTYTLINGGKDSQEDTDLDDVEANLDVQYAMSLAYKVKTVFYSTGGLGPLVPDNDQPTGPGQNEPYLDFLHYLLKLPDSKLPQTLSTSYGEDEQSVPKTYTDSVCNLFAQLGARGVSVIFSSGDTGVGSACQTNDGKNTTRFLPIFPAACPFVTSVGGTTKVNPEQAVSFSSGGFSDRYARPKYQDAAVSAYLKKLGSRWQGLYNPHGRGFPDVAAQGVNFSVVDKGAVIPVGGTSASAPTFAGIISLLNSARLDKGKRPLGFLNPWIYGQAYKSGFTDITHGGSKGCTGKDIYSGLPTPFVPYASWNATEGWDPVTGVGTPRFDALLKMTLSGY